MQGEIQKNVQEIQIFFYIINSSSSRLMKAIRLIPVIHALKQQF